MSLLELFCHVDDFMLNFLSQWKASQLAARKQRERAGQLCASEVMTILIHFHQSHYRTFKAYYTEHLHTHTGIFKMIQEQVRFGRARFGQYDLIDFSAVLIGYILSGEPTLLSFYERLAPFRSRSHLHKRLPRRS